MAVYNARKNVAQMVSRSLLLRTASVAVIAGVVGVAPAHAQLAARRGATLTAPTVTPRATAAFERQRAANQALDRSVAGQERVGSIRAYVAQARAAAAATVRPVPTEGLTANGLVPIASVRRAIELTRAGDAAGAALATSALSAARDSLGTATWQGASLPSEKLVDGKTLVSITQNESRAILSWDRFDVGRNTVVSFDQKVSDVALNRVANSTAPSTILGEIKGQGTVLVLNNRGVIFGNGAQVNTNSFLASSLEIGNFVRASTLDLGYRALTLAERNTNFLQNGLLQDSSIRSVDDGISATLTASLIAPGVFQAANIGSGFTGAVEGDVVVDRGAKITAGKGGFVILTAPTVSNDGRLSAPEGQVSLQAGRAISATPSTGAAGSIDPNIRGLVLRTSVDTGGGSATNSGLIDVPRGHISLGAGLTGSVTNSGLLQSTTSVSRNGSVSLTAGTVTLAGNADKAQASGIVIGVDESKETIPQGSPDEPANFKASQIQIGAAYISTSNSAAKSQGVLGGASISIGENALILAPNANVDIGGKAGQGFSRSELSVLATGIQLPTSKIEIAGGAVIDVSGVKDVQLDASRNSLLINRVESKDPVTGEIIVTGVVKRNELRDTPNYRETNTTGAFTLNGAAISVDPRISGVRDDGVAYIGSPLIEAGSAAAQIGVSAAELMTKGGNVNLSVTRIESQDEAASAGRIAIGRDAIIDISGGWVRYAEGIVRTSRLLTADGRIVDIGRADPNDSFVAVGDGFSEVQAKFGVERTYANAILNGGRFEAGYDEGRDAGALTIAAPLLNIDGTIFGQAFAGARQITAAARSSGSSGIAGDLRKLQKFNGELPSGGYVSIGSFVGSLNGTSPTLGGDIKIGTADAADATGTVVIRDTLINAAGLSALLLNTSGAVTFARGSNVTLANGGQLAVRAGRAITLDGTVTAPGGRISAATIGGTNQFSFLGSAFRSDDDLPPIGGIVASQPNFAPFDITVGGSLSTAGLWVNDADPSGGAALGRAWTNGGSISLTNGAPVRVGVGTVAPNGTQTITAVTDLAGVLTVAPNAMLNVSSGGYVAANGDLSLTAKGGSISLVNPAVYASTQRTDTTFGSTNTASDPVNGRNQSVTFTSRTVLGDGEITFVSALVPETQRAEVRFEASSLKGFGFDGGGTFTLVAPDVILGSGPSGRGPVVGLDFLQKTGFGTLDLSSTKSRIVREVFSNGILGNSAFFETTRFVVGAGETLNLTQSVLPSLLDAQTIQQLRGLGTGADITSVLTPAIPADIWDQKAANLVLGGLTELDVQQGGTIIGAAGATITAPKLYNAGTIRIVGGQITQSPDPTLPAIFRSRLVGVRDTLIGGAGLAEVFGPADVNGQFDENIPTLANIFSDNARLNRLTNGDLFRLVAPSRNFDVTVVFTGRVGIDEGMRFTSGSVTDVSGAAIYNPRAPLFPTGTRQITGRLIGGGVISSAVSPLGASNFVDGQVGVPRSVLHADAGATIKLDGASAIFDERVTPSTFGRVSHWSDGGKLIIGTGARLSGVNLSAVGGDDGDANVNVTRANAGVIDWFAPVIRQTDNGLANDGALLFADDITKAGFGTAIVRNGFTVQGDVTLNLNRAFIATTDDVTGRAGSGQLSVVAASGSNATIVAPYVRLNSSDLAVIPGDGLDSNGVGAITLRAKAIDVVGAVNFNVSSRSDGVRRGQVILDAATDIRLIGASARARNIDAAPSLTGQLVANGDLTLRAGQVYATTGTGNLQQAIEAQRAGKSVTPSPFIIASSNIGGTVRFEGRAGAIPDTPYSAGSYLRVLGANIEQNGVLRAPLGLLQIGANENVVTSFGLSLPATQTLRFGPDSLTSVSARVAPGTSEARNVPYGTTTDLIEYFFSPSTTGTVTAAPVGELRLAGKDIRVLSDSANEVRIDARGGGDVFAYEFVPGTGGSRDVLDRFNPDIFSGNDGLQFPDGRQVFAILPKDQSSSIALYDPLYSADYSGGGGVDLYGRDAGRTILLDAAPGIEAGEYLLLPAKYALLPGALRIVENTQSDAPVVGGAATLLDGSVIVGGAYATAGTEFVQSQRRSFTVQTRDVFSKYARIETTSATDSARKLAERAGAIAPRSPLDAARILLSPLTSLRVAGVFDTAAAPGGRGAQVDIGGARIRIARPGATQNATSDFVLLTTDTLANFNANSLSIGALRTDNVDGTTRLDVVANTIEVDGDVKLSAPELLLAVGGPGSRLIVKDGPTPGVRAELTASGVLSDNRTGDYIINATTTIPAELGTIDFTGSGSLLRLANGAERLVTRQGDFAQRTSLLPSRLDIGAATLLGSAIALDTSRLFVIDRGARFGAAPGGTDFLLSLSADGLRVGGGNFRPEVEAQFAQASRVTLRSPDIVYFSAATHNYQDLTIDAPGIGLAQPLPGTASSADVTINANHVVLRNGARDLGACKDVGARFCAALSALTVNASDITFGGGQFRTFGFDGGLTGRGIELNAQNGMYIEGTGGFSTASFDESLVVPVTLRTPFIVDRTTIDSASPRYVRPDYTFTTLGALNIIAPVGAVTPVPQGREAPGARIAFNIGNENNGADTLINGTIIRATAGVADIKTYGNLTLSGAASVATPGYTRSFNDGVDTVTVSAGAGTINLVANGGGSVVDAAATTTLIVDNGIGKAGTLNVASPGGEVILASRLNPGVATNIARSASFNFESGQSAFDLSGFVRANGTHFQGDLTVRTGDGNLTLDAAQVLRADSVNFTADGGIVSIAGTIDTSGDDVSGIALTDPRYKEARVNGGNISLFGQEGVTLTASSALFATTGGYGARDTRQASGGNVTLGIGIPENAEQTATLAIAQGATINVGALRPGDRLIDEIVKDDQTRADTVVYRLAEGDRGGIVSLRAPVLSTPAGDRVNILSTTQPIGARAVEIEAYRRFDLPQIAASGAFSGVTQGGSTFLNLNLTRNGDGQLRPNFFTDVAPGTLPDFVRNLNVTGPNGEVLTNYHVRPGIELNSSERIELASIWNLGAGQIVNADRTPGYTDAVAAGLLRASPLGRYTTGPLTGQMRYEVVTGKEAELFNRFVDLSYRVGGRVDGAAPVVSIRAGGDLEIQNSITDGFFAFHDKTSADYLSYQLGGGNRTYSPAINFSCGSVADICSNNILFGQNPPIPTRVPITNRVNVTLNTILQGTESSPLFVNAPYAAGANAVSAGGTGDPLGVAELFPLLSNGDSVHSSSIKLVGGAALGSANPLRTDRTRSGNVTISGEKSYDVVAVRPVVDFAGPLQLSYRLPRDESGEQRLIVDTVDQFIDRVNADIAVGEAEKLDPDFYTVLTWGAGSTGAAADARRAATASNSVFVLNGGIFNGPRNSPTGVAAPLKDVLAFLSSTGFGGVYSSAIARDAPGYSLPSNLRAPTASLLSRTAYIGTTVRTGDGSIDVAASTNIDLLRTRGIVRRQTPGTLAAQVGGTAVYTAGTRTTQSILRGASVPAEVPTPIDNLTDPGTGVQVTPVYSRNGGGISLVAGGNITGRRDVWSEINASQPTRFAVENRPLPSLNGIYATFGSVAQDQRWRVGTVDRATKIAIVANNFTSGVGALAGGDVRVVSGGSIDQLTTVLTNSLVMGATEGARTLVTLGGGNLSLVAGGNLKGGQIDVASGTATLRVGGDVSESGRISTIGAFNVDDRNLLRLRVSDATANVSANGSIVVGDLGALGFGTVSARAGLFSALSGADLSANGSVELVGNLLDVADVLPPSLAVTSLNGDIAFGGVVATSAANQSLFAPRLLYPSQYGQLSLVSGGNISRFGLAMSDADPSDLPGFAFGSTAALEFGFPTLLPTTSDGALRLLHNRRVTHLNDPVPNRIIVAGSISDAAFSLPKQTRISAGGDIVNLYYEGQNVNAGDVTRIAAGRDITATPSVNILGRSFSEGNSMVVGGPGTLFVEAGRDLGPFATSATIRGVDYAGGIRTIGNESNPWLGSQGANIYALFGVGNGANYDGLQSTYLDPANLAKLDGDLFVQQADQFGNKSADRTKPTYAPLLAAWLKEQAPQAYRAVFGDTAFDNDLAFNAAAYQRYDDLYRAFAGLAPLERRRFLVDKLYFGELSAPADPKGPSLNQFIRGYRAIEALFPAKLGYTDNLATYETDPATITANNPLGVPTRRLINGQPIVAVTKNTGNVDLRLSTIQTTRGGDVTILGPGGNFVAGSVVRTSEQVRRRSTILGGNFEAGVVLNLGNVAQTIDAIPLGAEGILTLRGGAIRGFTDADFRLNQSRLFTQRGGDIALWSSNGDLNAGQGPKSASNFPPIVVRFDPNGFAQVDSAGSVAGAGIAAFRPAPEIPASSVTLVAPVGTVDAGDAGVRASGDVFVAAARVANADNFQVGGTSFGVPSLGVAAAPALPSSAASAIAANSFRASDAAGQGGDRTSRIFVDVLGYFGSGAACPEGEVADANGQCKPQ
jgi:filamentous hemagglutinin family protein